MAKHLTEKQITNIESEVILMLLNCAEMEVKKGGYKWNCNNAYYGEAFGIMRGLVNLGYCYWGASNTPRIKLNAKWWFCEIQNKTDAVINKFGYEKAIITYNELVSKIYDHNKKAIIRTINSQYPESNL